MPRDAPSEAKRKPSRKGQRGPWREAVTEPWRVMVFVWQTLMAALLPISLRDVPLGLERFLEHLHRSNGSQKRSAATFERRLQESSG